MNYDPRLLDLCCFRTRDVADVRASVCHVHTVDGQDTHSLYGVRQAFTRGFSLDPILRLVRGKEYVSN